jgi:hypothetical protein
MIRLGFVFFAILLAGCQSERWGPYSLPRISGRVLAADTQQPVSAAMVSRHGRPPTANTSSPPKGSELMIRKVPIRTDDNGQFVLESERVLSIFRGSGWSQLQLHIEKPGYVTVETNFPMSLATNLPGGVETLELGQILLQPVNR